MDYSKLKNKKLELLNRVYDLTKSTVFGNDTEANIRRYTTLYSRRAGIIDEIKAIDQKIKNEPKEQLTTHEMDVVIQKIIDEDNRIAKYEDEFMAYAQKKETENKK